MPSAQVSKWTPFGVALDLRAVSRTVSRTSATAFTVDIDAHWETYYSGAQTNFGMTATSGGKTVTLNTFGVKSSGSTKAFTGTYSISGNGAATKSITVAFKNFNDDTGRSATRNLTLNVSVPAWTSYTVKYDANGGSGAPSSQTKWKDQTLALSSTVPTRTGHTFKGWSTTKQTAVDGSATFNYKSGALYTANSAVTLYAVWQAYTYQVTYNANGGTNAPAAQTKTYGVTLTLTNSKPVKVNHTFKGWATSANSTTIAYASGASYTSNAKITLYAVWELSYTKPRITNFSVTRCDVNGSVSDRGTYATVKFTYACSRDIAKYTISVIDAAGSVISSDTVTYDYASLSGSISTKVGGSLSTESTYTIKVTVIDDGDSVGTTKSLTLPGIKFAVDFKAGGRGAAFGKPAELDDYVDFGFDAVFNNTLAIAGRDLSGSIKEAFQPQNENGNTVIGWGNYDLKSGNTNIYGHDVLIGVGNNDKPGTYRPYIRKGDSFEVTVRTAGYVTNSGKDVSFFVPMTRPIVGSPGITATSNKGITLRQNGSYTHGSTADTSVFPDSYTATFLYTQGVMVTASFTTTTNVTNNDSIGIYWNGTLTFT